MSIKWTMLVAEQGIRKYLSVALFLWNGLWYLNDFFIPHPTLTPSLFPTAPEMLKPFLWVHAMSCSKVDQYFTVEQVQDRVLRQIFFLFI